MEEPTPGRMIEARHAVSGPVVIGDAGKVFRLAEFDELTYEQIEISVIVVVKPHGARRPAGSRDAGLLCDIGKRAVAVIVVENAASVLRDVYIGEAVSVIVPYRHALTVASAADTCLFGDVGESAVAVIAIKRVAQGRVRIVEIAFATVDQIDVHPAVIVIVEKGASRSRGFRQVFLRRFSCGVDPGDPAGFGRHFLERVRRARGHCRIEPLDARESGGSCKGPKEVPARKPRAAWHETGHCGLVPP